MMDHAALRYIQIDTGRGRYQLRPSGCPGGTSQGLRQNHTFTTHLALSASLQPVMIRMPCYANIW